MGKYQAKLSRPRYKFLRQIRYGILTSRHLHMNKISSQLGESIRLKKTSERLSRHLGQEDLREELMKGHIEIHDERITSFDMALNTNNSKQRAKNSKALLA